MGAQVYMVSDYSTDYTYEAWGVSNGSNVCCETSSTIDEFEIQGTDLSDTLMFNWDALTYNMEVTATGIILGGDANDTIEGSDYASFYDYLYGGAANDAIKGHAGDDYIYGDGEGDTLHGGPGDDHIWGGAGNDSIEGNQDNDTIYGEAGQDFISGNAGDDYIDGGTEGDVICGGGDVYGDTLDDGDTTDEGLFSDRLWGGEDADDAVQCGSTSTRTDSNSTASSLCSTDLTSYPSQCP